MENFTRRTEQITIKREGHGSSAPTDGVFDFEAIEEYTNVYANILQTKRMNAQSSGDNLLPEIDMIYEVTIENILRDDDTIEIQKGARIEWGDKVLSVQYASYPHKSCRMRKLMAVMQV